MTADGDEGAAFVELVERRTDLLELLAEPHAKSEMVASLDASRSTVDRAIRRLRNAGLVRQEGGAYVRSFTGRVAVQRHRAYRRELRAAAAAEPVVAPLSRDTELDVALLDGATATRSEEPTPYRALEPLHDAVAAADDYRGVLPTLDDPRHFRLLYEHVVTEGNPATLTVSGALATALREEFPRRLDVLRDHDGFDLRVGPTPEYGLVVTASAGDRTATAVVFDGGTVHGTLRNGSEAAVEWAHERLAAVEDGADRVRANEEADVEEDTEDDDTGGLPTKLERQGFVRLTPSFFVERSVADPETAWRAGLGLPEVQAGYAVERRDRDDGTEAGQPIHRAVADRLRDGGDCVVVGPPGAGKSTVARQVACRWYRAGEGFVLYRGSGTSAAAVDPDDLVAALADAEGTPLVVVEDITRPDAAPALAARRRARERDIEVRFLFDARRHELEADPDVSGVRGRPPAEVTRVELPALDEADAEALLELAESLTGRSPAISPAELLVTPDGLEEGTARPHDMLLATHRLAATLAGEDERTGLTEAVDDLVATTAEGGQVRRDVTVLVNLLNAAGVGVTRGLVHASVGSPGTVDPDAVDAALAELEGRVLFGAAGTDPDADGAYRTVHEEWSRTFLARYLERVDDDPAAVGTRLLDGVLSLARDEARCDEMAEAIGDGTGRPPASVAEIDGIAEGCYRVARARPRLTPLFGHPDADEPSPDLSPCSPAVALRCRLLRGKAFWDRGDAAPARRDLAAVLEGTDDRPDGEDAVLLRARALRRLGDIAREQGDLDGAEAQYERLRSLGRETGHPRVEGMALSDLGKIDHRRGYRDRAVERYEESLERCRTAGYRRGEADALNDLGIVAGDRGDLDAAVDYFERALSIYRSLESTARITPLNNLGKVATLRGDYETAMRYHREALAVRRRRGRRRMVASSLVNLAEAAWRAGDHETALEHAEESAEVARETGADLELANGLRVLADARRANGALDDAATAAEESLELYREAGTPQGEAEAGRALAAVRHEQGRLDEAVERARTARERFAELDAEERVATVDRLLGRIAADRGDDGTAAERFEAAVEGFRSAGAPGSALDAAASLIDLHERRGDDDAVAAWRETAATVAAEAGLDRRRQQFEAGMTTRSSDDA